MLPPTFPHQKTNRAAVAWALIGQSVWIPVFVINSQDQLISKTTDYDFSGSSKLPYQDLSRLQNTNLLNSPALKTGTLISKSQSSEISSGIVLNAVEPSSRQLISVKSGVSSPISFQNPSFFAPSPPPPSSSSSETALLIKPGLINRENRSNFGGRNRQFSSDFIQRLYNRADLLGGTVTLRDLNEPEMPPIARAERAQWIRTGDPLAPIPQIWRESMRKALHNLTFKGQQEAGRVGEAASEILSIDTARIVHVPSKRLKRAADVPLAIQSDGSVDILNNPDDPAVLEEIKSWSASQQPPSKGRMTPAVVHLHPLSPIEGRSLVSAQASTKASLRLDQEPGAKTRATSKAPSTPPASFEPSSIQPSTAPPAPVPPLASVQSSVDLRSEPPPQPQAVDVSNATVISNGEAKQ
jgi:hypothetical protein